MIIGICGKKHSGKSTAENMLIRLVKEANKTVASYSLAAPIKHLASYITGEPLELWNSDEGKRSVCPRLGITRRQFLTDFGTDFIHKYNPKIWTQLFDDKLKEMGKSIVWIIPDVRMSHEVNYINSKRSIIIKVQGDPADLEDGHNSNHKSETEVDNIKADHVLDTDKLSKLDMINTLKSILKQHDII